MHPGAIVGPSPQRSSDILSKIFCFLLCSWSFMFLHNIYYSISHTLVSFPNTLCIKFFFTCMCTGLFIITCSYFSHLMLGILSYLTPGCCILVPILSPPNPPGPHSLHTGKWPESRCFPWWSAWSSTGTMGDREARRWTLWSKRRAKDVHWKTLAKKGSCLCYCLFVFFMTL